MIGGDSTKGRSIYFTEKELKAVRTACSEYLDIMGEGEETVDEVDEMIDNGLGSALYKLYKGYVNVAGEEPFKKYKRR